jgi:hypothetical protein
MFELKATPSSRPKRSTKIIIGSNKPKEVKFSNKKYPRESIITFNKL